MAEEKSSGAGGGGPSREPSREYVPPAKKTAPRMRCPRCKQLIEELEYGQYTWNNQWYTPAEDDWSTSEYSYEGDVVLTVACSHCSADITQYVLHREQRLGELDTTPTDFNHDVQLKRGLTYDRSSGRLPKHTARYMDEFTFRLNDGNVKNRTMARLDSMISAANGKRLTYKRLVN